MNVFNFSKNGQTLEVILPTCLWQTYNERILNFLKRESVQYKIIGALVVFNLIRGNESVLLHDFSKILGLDRFEVLDHLNFADPSNKAMVLSIASEVCSFLVTTGYVDLHEFIQDETFSPELADLHYTLYACRLANHVLEFQLESEYRKIGWEV